MLVKVTVKTPKKQAASCMKTQKHAFLGLGGAKKIIEEKVINDSSFYWIVNIEPKKMKALTKNTARGEMIIKKFYKMLFKTIDRCNKLQRKFDRGAIWIKRQLIKRLKKQTQNSDDSSAFLKNINDMTDEELGEFITINDRAAMDKLLAGDLITLKNIEDDNPS